MTIPMDEADPADAGRRAQLFVEGQLAPAGPEATPVVVRRGMLVRCQDGEDAGQVAAVVCGPGSRTVTHVLLSRWRGTLDYRVIPIGLVQGVHDDAVVLGMPGSAVDALPRRSTI
jgi:hypothetical protein